MTDEVKVVRQKLYYSDDISAFEHFERLMTGSAILWLRKQYYFVRIIFMRFLSEKQIEKTREKLRLVDFYYQFYCVRNEKTEVAISFFRDLSVEPKDVRYLALGGMLDNKGRLNNRRIINNICLYIGWGFIGFCIYAYADLFANIILTQADWQSKFIVLAVIGAIIAWPMYVIGVISIKPTYAANRVLSQNTA